MVFTRRRMKGGGCPSDKVDLKTQDETWCDEKKLTRQKLFLLHPDRNPGCRGNATQKFQDATNWCETPGRSSSAQTPNRSSEPSSAQTPRRSSEPSSAQTPGRSSEPSSGHIFYIQRAPPPPSRYSFFTRRAPSRPSSNEKDWFSENMKTIAPKKTDKEIDDIIKRIAVSLIAELKGYMSRDDWDNPYRHRDLHRNVHITMDEMIAKGKRLALAIINSNSFRTKQYFLDKFRYDLRSGMRYAHLHDAVDEERYARQKAKKTFQEKYDHEDLRNISRAIGLDGYLSYKPIRSKK